MTGKQIILMIVVMLLLTVAFRYLGNEDVIEKYIVLDKEYGYKGWVNERDLTIAFMSYDSSVLLISVSPDVFYTVDVGDTITYRKRVGRYSGIVYDSEIVE